jgi:hypothetical protein
MRKTAPLNILLLALLFTGVPLQSQPRTSTGQSDTGVPSKVACSDTTTLPVVKRSPETCAESDFAQFGRPVMFPLRNGVAYGASIAPGDASSITIWMDNQSDKPQNYLFCCNATFIETIELYDAAGRRIPSKHELAVKKLKESGQESIEACDCSGWVTVPPHTLKVVDHGDLSSAYTLPAGPYTIVERSPIPVGAYQRPAPSPTLPASGPRLSILRH